MGFDEQSSMVGTSASDKMGADSPDYANMGSGNIPMEPAGAGLGQANDWAMSGAQDQGSMADNTSVGSISTSS
ncbi:MAG: hypothetical protein KKA60_06330 [Proteobacteria bacterium]|nr:hypothetical protein [Pseudomonadota bacterium]